MNLIFYVLIILTPALFLFLETKFKFFKTIGVVVWCYGAGILMGNLPFFIFPTDVSHNLSNATVPLAIPVLLFATQFLTWLKSSKSTLLSFLFSVISVIISSMGLSFIFRPYIPDIHKIAGMLIGVYTGGTPNMTAIGVALGVSDDVFIKMNGVDIIVGSIYLLFLMSLGIRVFSLFLPQYKKQNIVDIEADSSLFAYLNFVIKIKNILLHAGLSILILVISYLLNQVFFTKINLPFILLCLSTGGILISFNSRIRHLAGSYELGQYLLLIFCVSIGSLANLTELFRGMDVLLFYTATTLICSVLLHSLFAYVFKIDRDTMMITSTASIFGPPFVGCIADAIGNREVVVAGITTGLVGYALGNFLGLGVAYLLQ